MVQTVSDGTKTRFQGMINAKTGKVSAGSHYTKALAHAQKAKCTSTSQTVQAAGI